MRPIIFLLIFLCAVQTVTAVTEIKVDQVGYMPGTPKIAMVVSGRLPAGFTVRRVRDGSVAFTGNLTKPFTDPDSGDQIQIAEFTGLNEIGEYYLEIQDVGKSWNFTIGPKIYSRIFYLAMRSYYGQRCGIAVDMGPEYPGYKYAVCHLNGAHHASSGKKGPHSIGRGWHDAGDYGRYIVNSGITTSTLLWTWELFSPRVKNVKLNIPESKNSIPDFLDEIKWNLDWMLSMQDKDGGVWQKQTSENFCGFIMPEKDDMVSYVVGTGSEPYKSSCATADFAATMAIAARVYRPFNAVYAKRALTASEQAWSWVEKHPNVLFNNPAGVVTGQYDDKNCGDERLWASAELWRTTGKAAYHQYFLNNFPQYKDAIKPQGPQAWDAVAPLALWTYALGKGKDAATVNAIRQVSLKAADEIVDRSRRNGYRISMTASDYIWGSNGIVANYGVQLLVANILQPNSNYVQTALENLHYLLGRNTFSLSWVTQVGANPFLHPHHRPSGADKNDKPWPGLLSGGPNQSRQDPAMRKLPQNLPPAKMYLDEEESYATNENAINWNAPLVFVLAGVMNEK